MVLIFCRMKKGEFDEMIVKDLTGDAVMQKDETNIMNDLVNVISDSSDVDDSQDVKTVQQNIMKQQIKGKDEKNQQNITCVKSSTKSLKEFNNEMGYSNEFRISDKPPNSVELDSDENSETFLPLEPLAQYHCAGSDYVRYPGQQSEPTNHMSYHPKIKWSGDNSEHSLSKSSITPAKKKHSVRFDNSMCTLSASKITPTKRKLPSNYDEMSESSDKARNLITTPVITECNDYQRRKVFSPKTFKINITPSTSFTESLNDYTPPSGRRKGKVKSRHNSDRYRKQSEDEIICKDDGSLNWSEFQQRCKYPVSESELLIPSHVDLLPGSFSEQHTSKFTGEHTSEFLPENLDMKSVDMNKNIRNAPCSNQFLSSYKITDQCSDSDSDSLPDLHTVITNKTKSHMDNYWQQELDSNKNTSQINCDINQHFLNKKKMDQMKTDNLKFNSGNEISAESLPFVDIKNNNVKPLYCENSNSVTVTKSEEDYSDKIPLIQAVLPHVTRHKARAMLIQYKGNADLCVAALLDSSSPVEGPMVDLT